MAQPEPGAGAELEREVLVGASPEIVFAHFTDPERMCRWMGVAAQTDPRPGGIYRVDITGRNVVRGEYVEVVPYRRVVFTWGWEDAGNPLRPGRSRVEVTLTPSASGTVVRLRHTGLPEELRGAHSEGWDHYLPRLAIAGSGADAGPDPWATSTPA